MIDPRRSTRITRRALLLGGAALAAGSLRAQDAPLLSIRPEAPPVPPPLPRRVRIKGAAAPIEIVDDHWGIPHIRAQSRADAFFGQGYAVARDRLFQLDHDYRRQQGRLAEAFGPDHVDSDIRAAVARYRGDIDAELRAVPDEVRACAEAYVAGINARIDQAIADPALLPIEHAALGLKPIKWSLADLVAARPLAHGDAAGAIRRAQLAAAGRLDVEQLVAPSHPPRIVAFPPGLEVDAVEDADLGILASFEAGYAADGGDAWTIAASRSATGRPILASAPHKAIGGFGAWHVAHLSAPGFDVIGGGTPGRPGVAQGHTDRFAFGCTAHPGDVPDLFILELNPVDPERYWHRAQWKTFERHEVSIDVRGEKPRRIVVRRSVHGPVVAHDPTRRRATALAGVTHRPGGSGVFALVAINQARDWKALQTAFRHHPSTASFHYADVDGHIAWRLIGAVPRRRDGQDGSVPAPGDGRYDWDGVLPTGSAPNISDPASGWLAGADQSLTAGDDKRETAPVAADTWRADRVAAVLNGQSRHAISDSVALMHDVVSTPARRFVALLSPDLPTAATPAVAMLRSWDGRLTADSAPAALFELAWADLRQRLTSIVLPMTLRARLPQLETGAMLALIESPDARLGPNPTGSRDLIVAMALIAGWEEAVRRMGPEPALWRWGTLHDVRVVHPLAAHDPVIESAFPAIEAGGSGGDANTVMARWTAPDMGVSGGATYAQVIDVGAWDDSVFLNFPGQSGDPASAHYGDMVQPWIEGRMLPLLFSRERIDAQASARTILDPG